MFDYVQVQSVQDFYVYDKVDQHIKEHFFLVQIMFIREYFKARVQNKLLYRTRMTKDIAYSTNVRVRQISQYCMLRFRNED